MADDRKDQIQKWLKKLERESWQLELLVSAFTIFLLLGAKESYAEFLRGLGYTYSFDGSILSFVYFFLSLLDSALLVLTIFLVIHLLLRGFWIGTIGLRSVQPRIAYDKLKYSKYFEDRLKTKIIELDRLIAVLDELCSVIFSVSFLIIFMLISFGLYILFIGALSFLSKGILGISSGVFQTILFALFAIIQLSIFFGGIIYLIDYFSLGFFKKQRWFARIYYPIYRFFGVITMSFVSRSIYYNLISKYRKSRIRMVYLIVAVLLFSGWFVNYDQYQFYPGSESVLEMQANFYDDFRDAEDYIEKVSIDTRFVKGDFLSLFIRYRPNDNEKIRSNCPEFEPMKSDGFNSSLRIISGNGNFLIQQQNYDEEDKEALISCLSSFYQISINDSLYENQKFYFAEHPAKGQKGLSAVIATSTFREGENILKVQKKYLSDSAEQVIVDYASLPFWFSPDR